MSIAWIILIMENLFLAAVFLIWYHRKCIRCYKIKSISQVFDKFCDSCQKDRLKLIKENNNKENGKAEKEKPKEHIDIF